MTETSINKCRCFWRKYCCCPPDATFSFFMHSFHCPQYVFCFWHTASINAASQFVQKAHLSHFSCSLSANSIFIFKNIFCDFFYTCFYHLSIGKWHATISSPFCLTGGSF